MASLLGWLKKANPLSQTSVVRDFFDANTQADYARRKQAASVNTGPLSPQAYQQRMQPQMDPRSFKLGIAQGLARNTAKIANTIGASAATLPDTLRAQVAIATHNPGALTAANQRITQLNRNINSPTGGLLNVGTIQGGRKMSNLDAIKSGAGVGAQAFTEIYPWNATGRAVTAWQQGARSVPRLMGRLGLEGGAASGVYNVGQQVDTTGKVDPKQVAKATAMGAAIGAGAGYLVPKSLQMAGSKIRQTFGTSPKNLVNKQAAQKSIQVAKQTLNTAKNKRIDLQNYGGTPQQMAAAKKAETQALNQLKHQQRLYKINRKGPGLSMEEVEARRPKAIAPPTQPTVTAKLQSTIDPQDPFGRVSKAGEIRGTLSKALDDDAEMIRMLKKVEKDTGKKGLVDQFYFDTGNVRASASIANAKLRNSPELKQVFSGLSKKQLKDFDEYAGARAELNNYKGLKTSRETPELQAIVSRGAQHEGRFNALNQYYKGMAKDMHEAGLIDAPTLKRYLDSNDYIRIQRDMDDLVNQQFGQSRARSIGSTSATQKRTGSGRAILPPSQSVFKRTQQLTLEAQRNKAASSTLDVLEQAGLAKKVTDSKNKNTISRMVDGKKETFEVPADIKRVMDNVNPYHLGVVARIVSAPVRLFRAGTTALSAPFTVTNWMRDQASSALYSKSVKNTHNPMNIIKGLGSSIRDTVGESRSPLWKKFEQYAGDQTIYDELRNVSNTRRLQKELRRGQAGKVENMVLNPIRTLEDLNSITERSTRFQNFKGMYDKTLKATGNEQEAIKAAVIAARQNSVDFQRSSAFTRGMNLFIPYFNASVQGSRNVARSFKQRPVATSMKSIGFIVAPSIAMTAWNLSDEDRRKAYDSINDFEKEDNFIIVTPNAKQNEDGSWEGIVKIPKPQGYRELTDPAREVAESFMKGEAVEDVADMYKDMLGGLTGPIDIEDSKKLVGSFTPQQIKPWVQQAANKDLYTGSAIVPDYMMDETDDPTKRAFKGTSGSARWIANKLGVSPIQVEKAIQDVAGSVGRYGINASDNILASQGKIPQEQIGGRSIASDFSRRLFEASGKLLDENKTPGRKYYENVDAVSKGLNKNELAAFNSIHPSKTNFLGEDIFDENKRISNYTRAGAYLNNPGVLEADRKLDQLGRAQGNPGNPLFDLPKEQLTRVLLKSALPPGAKDPELSALWKEDWYQNYQIAREKYYGQVKQSLAKQGKTLPQSNNPYPETPPDLQKVMDQYSALPKGTGARSAWIKANPDLFNKMVNQWQATDAWENKERVAMGLSPISEDFASNYGSGGGKKGPPSLDLQTAKYASAPKAPTIRISRKPTYKKASLRRLAVSKLPKVVG